MLRARHGGLDRTLCLFTAYKILPSNPCISPNISSLMSSSNATDSPGSIQDTNHETVEGSIRRYPFVSVLTIDGDKHTYTIKPGSALAFVPNGGKPDFEDQYERVKVHSAIPWSEKQGFASLDHRNLVGMHGADSIITWWPNGSKGPSTRITILPFCIISDQFGDCQTPSLQNTVPLPPPTDYTPTQKRLAQQSLASSQSQSDAASSATTSYLEAQSERFRKAKQEEKVGGRTRSGLPLKPWQK